VEQGTSTKLTRWARTGLPPRWGPGGGTFRDPVSRNDHRAFLVTVAGRIAGLVLLALILGLLDGRATGVVTAFGGPSGGTGFGAHPLAGVTMAVHLISADGPVVGRVTTGPGGQLSMRLRPGRYVISPPQGWVCTGTIVVLPFQLIGADPVCAPAP
jgi:hypothetical protein